MYHRNSKYVEAGCAFGIFVYSVLDLNHAFFTTFLARDLDRVQALLKGSLIFFGPELSEGGHLPGAFYYYFISLPFALFGWVGVYHFIVALGGLTAAVLYLYMRRTVGFFAAAFAFVAFTQSLGIRSVFRYFGNPSVMPILSVAILLLLSELFSDTLKDRRKPILWLGLLFGLAVQAHLMIALFFAAAVVLQIFAPQLKLRRFTWAESWPALVVVVAVLTPYLIWSAVQSPGMELGQAPLAFASGGEAPGEGESFSSVTRKSVLGLLEKRSGSFLRMIPISTLIPFLIALILIRVVKTETKMPYEVLVKKVAVTGICTLMGIVPMLPFGRPRYYLCGLVALCFLWAYWLEMLRRRWTTNDSLIAGAIALFTAIYFVVGTMPVENPPLIVGESTKISNAIIEQTGWDYTQARKRLYYVNGHPAQNLRYIFDRAYARMDKPETKNNAPDGFLIAMFTRGTGVVFKKNPNKWLEQNLEPSLAEGVRAGAITVGEPHPISRRTTLMPYFVKDKEKYPAFFQNRSEEYTTDQEKQIDELSKLALAEPNKTKIAVFNSCPERPTYCRIAISVQSEDLRDPKKPVRANVLGIPLALPARRMSPNWNQILFAPYLRFHCDGVQTRITLAGQIGLPPKKSREGELIPLLAPFERGFTPPCTGRIDAVTIGYDRSEASDLNRKFSLEGEAEMISLTDPNPDQK